jgi:hypothetical protein
MQCEIRSATNLNNPKPEPLSTIPNLRTHREQKTAETDAPNNHHQISPLCCTPGTVSATGARPPVPPYP